VIKVYALLPKRPDITAERFHEHWSTIHREHALRIDRLRRYVQAHRIHEDLEGIATSPYEGVPEVWYESRESALGQQQDPNYTEYAQRDEPNFVDMTGIAWVHTDERLLRDDLPLEQDTDVAKLLLFVRRAEGMSPEAFAERWPAVAADLAAGAGVRRAAMATTLSAQYAEAEPSYDGVLELWWPDLDALRADWATHGPALLDGLATVADVGRSRAHVAYELRVIWPGPPRPEQLQS
jgi:uncharacterized protein (TIGR02118 family)